MSIQNTLVQANRFFEFVNEQKEMPDIFSLFSEQEGRKMPYPYDDVASIVMAYNPVIEALNVLFASEPSSTKTFSPQGGYVADKNSTTMFKPVEDFDILLKQKCEYFLSLLCTEDFEAGVAGQSEDFARDTLAENRTLALQMINQVYLENVGNAHVQIGILHLSSHIDYDVGFPNLQTIALAALSDKNDDVKDYAVQCYENWNHRNGLKVLKTIHSDTLWLQEYIDSVIVSLSENFPEEACVSAILC